ncbi:putative secreted protein [Candidatus Protofrankia californiensis]|uniref:Putative secreted protein n=1 Tax=Candidatus Protofrankia californiensis TaxID=1839754 RepID=A0A1C3PGT6_9ACTN|nr:putative secreted protein [Candidatus Protofrankia californiensis]
MTARRTVAAALLAAAVTIAGTGCDTPLGHRLQHKADQNGRCQHATVGGKHRTTVTRCPQPTPDGARR